MKCKGLLGLIFGHQFIKNKGSYTWASDYCYRCGRGKGDVE